MEHESQHSGHGDPKFLGYSIILASVILAIAIIYTGMGTFALSAKLTALPVVAAAPSVQATVQLQPSVAVPTAGPTAAPSTQGPTLSGPFRGSGNVVMVEFSDFECPFCARAHPTVKRIIEQDYAGKVKLLYKHFPLDSLHPDARRAGRAYECVRDQGDDKGFQYMDLVFGDQSDLSAAGITNLVKKIPGIDMAKFSTCLAATTKDAKVEADFQEGQTLGVSGTPAFFLAKLDASGKAVGGWQQVVGAQPYASFKNVIDGLLG